MSRYVISPEARSDLNEIWEYIAQDDFDAADSWVGKLRDAIELVARVPGIGHTRRDLTDHSVLFWPVGAYLIIYRVRNRLVEIAAVTHGARDIPSFLRGRTQ
ncbi:MAG: type II toxin-antitoxin system RelE/ParE family toxin [Terracidiphilus sp.]|jgi:plasmid stabilization system protein ParE